MYEKKQARPTSFIYFINTPPFFFYQVYISCWMQSAYRSKSDVISKAKLKSINSVEFSKQEKAKQPCNMWKKKRIKLIEYGSL